jgi:hypothetical protein
MALWATLVALNKNPAFFNFQRAFSAPWKLAPKQSSKKYLSFITKL